MSITNTNTAFFSGWDVDQLVTSNSLTVPSGVTTIYTFTDSSSPPTFEVQFKPTGASYWYQPGASTTNDTSATLFSFQAYISGTSLIISTGSAGTARFWIWQDKVNN